MFPVSDWQFWAATALVALVVGRGVWRIRPRRARGTKVRLTISADQDTSS